MNMRVLYVLGCNEGQSKRYRVFNQIEALALRGIPAEWIWDIHPEARDENYLKNFSIVVNFRGGYSDRLEGLCQILRNLSVPFVYDVDDLVFDPDLAHQVDAYRRMTPHQQQDYIEGIKSVSRAMSCCDYVTATTPFLVDYASKYSEKPAFLAPNAVNDQQIKIAESVSRYTGGPRYIGYLSGTNTHEQDFVEVAPALRRILTEYQDVYLKLVGFLDIESHLPGLGHKVVQRPFMDWQCLVLEIASLYLNIAPLEVESPFCQSKSDLKYFEPALSGVPTIASPTSAFLSSIESGRNGILAKSENEWYEAFKYLLNDQVSRNRMGVEAYLDVKSTRFPSVIGRKLEDVYSTIIDCHVGTARPEAAMQLSMLKSSKKGLKISWVIPQPFEGSGGHRNIFRAIRGLVDLGHSCSIHVLMDNHRFNQGEEIRNFITQEFFDVKAEEVWHGCNNITDCDVLICTYWTTAYVVKENAHKSLLHMYFLQDYEPFFFPMGTDYVRACETYKFGFYHITSGPWPLKMLEKEWGVTNGSFFRFPLDRQIYRPAVDKPRKEAPRIIYFARPDMPRRCYPLGLSALEIVKRERPNTEIVFYGDKAEKFNNVPFEFTNVGLAPRIEDLGDLYRSGDVGLCFSTTNPSLVPFEMMACGLPVVDLDINNNEVNYGGRDNCVLASANPRDIADKVYSVLDNPKKAEELVLRGVSYSKEFPNEAEMVRLIEQVIVREYDQVKSRHLDQALKKLMG
jgi:glycosyltransferase involved in cell wall biosynthesis